MDYPWKSVDSWTVSSKYDVSKACHLYTQICTPRQWTSVTTPMLPASLTFTQQCCEVLLFACRLSSKETLVRRVQPSIQACAASVLLTYSGTESVSPFMSLFAEISLPCLNQSYTRARMRPIFQKRSGPVAQGLWNTQVGHWSECKHSSSHFLLPKPSVSHQHRPLSAPT